MQLPPRRDQQRRFWSLIRSGDSVNNAAHGTGVSTSVGQRWFRKAGGMPPFSIDTPTGSLRLTITDRELIHERMQHNDSIRQIARLIGKAPSTVKRELDLNMRRNYRTQARLAGTAPGPPPSGRWDYSPHVAQSRADVRASRSRPGKLAQHKQLRDEVQDRLKKLHSPEQISRRLQTDFPDDEQMQVSHETIYQAIYVQGRGALKRELAACLRTGRVLRKPRRRPDQRSSGGRISGMVNISERPAAVEDRAVPGHWEGDLIVGKLSASAIGTLVERMTRFTMLLHLPHAHTAAAVEEAMRVVMAQLPRRLRRTLTWDQGKEMASHAQIAAATDLDIYFCDPHSPWQRGTNENTNGLLRQYFPKGTDLSVHTQFDLEHVAMELNNRPRKTLGWKTPAEALDELLSDPLNPPSVALTP